MSPEGRSVRCGGWAMNEILDFDHTALAELTSRRWQEDRPYFMLINTARLAWLEASWRRQPGRSAMELHWSRRAPCIVSADLFPPLQAVSHGV